MADTSRASYTGTPCSDCGQRERTEYKHWGELVPKGETGYFDQECFDKRMEESKKGLTPRPIAYNELGFKIDVSNVIPETDSEKKYYDERMQYRTEKLGLQQKEAEKWTKDDILEHRKHTQHQQK